MYWTFLLLAAAQRPMLIVHFMPWFQAKPPRAGWGWHWTMSVKKPDELIDGKPDIAAHYHPLIGPYDSDDEAVLEYQVQLMKLAGIDVRRGEDQRPQLQLAVPGRAAGAGGEHIHDELAAHTVGQYHDVPGAELSY